jgi:L-threonylcarbamoyladenylate synthase
METQVLPTTDPAALPLALETLATGQVVAFPTDTLYGLAADPWDTAAVERLFAAKERDYGKPIVLLVAGMDHLWRVVPGLPPVAQALASAFWPGPLTIVVPRHPKLPDIVTAGGPTVGLRVPDHPWALRLLAAAGGALAVTSANRSGQGNPTTAAEVLDELGGRIPLIIDGGPVPGGVASTVVDLTTTPPRVLREGAIPAQLLAAALAVIANESDEQ